MIQTKKKKKKKRRRILCMNTTNIPVLHSYLIIHGESNFYEHGYFIKIIVSSKRVIGIRIG